MSIFLYACETWTITADIERRIQALRDEMFPQTSRYLELRSHNQWRSENQNWKRHRAIWRPPDFSEKTQTEVARACHTIICTGKDYPTGNSSRRETKRQTEETMGRQHQRVDWPWMEYTTTESREPRGVEEAGCKIYSGFMMWWCDHTVSGQWCSDGVIMWSVSGQWCFDGVIKWSHSFWPIVLWWCDNMISVLPMVPWWCGNMITQFLSDDRVWICLYVRVTICLSTNM